MTEMTKQALDTASQEKAALILQACVRAMLARIRLDKLRMERKNRQTKEPVVKVRLSITY